MFRRFLAWVPLAVGQGEPSPTAAGSGGSGSRARWSGTAAGEPTNWGLLFAFLALFAGYQVIYYGTPLPSLQWDLPRIELLRFRVLLPEQWMPFWFGHSPAVYVTDRLPVLGVAAVILGFAAIAGRLLMRLLRMDGGLTVLETAIFSCGVGLNTISLYVLLVGVAGGLRAPFVFAGPAALLVVTAGWFWLRERRRVARQGAAAPEPSPAVDWLDGRWLWLGAPFVLAIMLGGMLPPVDFDVREYHLQAPKEFYLAGRIGFLPHNVYGNMVLGTEMLSLLAMVVLDDWWYGALAGKTLIAAVAPLTALGLLAAGRRFFSPAAGIVAALVYISIPWISDVSTSGLVEGVSAFYLLLAVYAVLLSRQSAQAAGRGGLGRAALAGFLAGAAVACKYPAALFVVLPLAAWRWLAGGRPNWNPAGVFLLAVLAGCGPWFAKNWALTDNPTYPLLYEVFGGASRTPDKNAQWLTAHDPPGHSVGQLAKSLAAVAWRSEWLSPLLMPLAAMALVVRAHRRLALVLVGYFVFVLATWWLLTHRIDRFWIPALPVVALLAGLGATWASSLAWRCVLLGVMISGLASNLLFVISQRPGNYTAYFAPLRELRDDPRRTDPWHIRLNRYLVPRGFGVLAVGDAEVFDLEMPVLYNTVFDDSVFEQICKGRKPEEIRAELWSRGISHIYVHWGEIIRYRRHGNYGFTDFVRPEVFAELVAHGVLDPPLQDPFHSGEVYPVREAGVDGTDPTVPLMTPAKEGG